MVYETHHTYQHNTLNAAVWNCNGALWTHPGRLEEVLEDRDLILVTETHESTEKALPRVEGYQWESLHRHTTRQGTSRGSGGVALLFRREMRERIQILLRDEAARFMWLSIQLGPGKTIYIAVCYFPQRGHVLPGHRGIQ